jgi:hypothetical protein
MEAYLVIGGLAVISFAIVLYTHIVDRKQQTHTRTHN